MDTVINFVIEKLVSKAISLADEQITLFRGFPEELTKLRETVTTIRAVLQDAVEQEVREHAIKLWLQRLKGVAREAEDVLDELSYEILRRHVETQLPLKQKVRNCFSFCKPNATRLELANKIKKINRSLNIINDEASRFGMRQGVIATNTILPLSGDEETVSFVDKSQVQGRGDDVSKIMNLLLSSGCDQQVLHVVPVVGMPGLGKTTLAKLVFNDVRVENHFSKRIWVYVSSNFDATRILREMLAYLTKTQDQLNNRNVIINKLKEEMREKNYLLILDNAWSTDVNQWDDLKECLSAISRIPGNRIIVTTRLPDTASASMVGVSRQIHQVAKLKDEDCLNIIKGRVFGDERPTELEESIAREIAVKCRGVPLVAKVLGGTMCCNRDLDEWRSIRDSEVWNSLGDGIREILKLSFDRLPSSSLKKCFAYCSIFPKGFVIRRDQLILLWKAQGFLEERRQQEKEVIGNNNFNYLLANSFFQDEEKDDYNVVESCKMHDLMHDIAIRVSESETLVVDNNAMHDLSHIWHLNLISTGEIESILTGDDAGKLHTLFSKVNILGKTWNFKSLRSLSLTGHDIKSLPSSIGTELKHLRYLDISRTLIQTLPESFVKLYHLETLIMEDCHALEKLPENFTNLVNLEHLYIKEEKHVPVGVGRLNHLQILPIFGVGQERGRRITELGSLSQLSGRLSIRNLEQVRGKSDVEQAKLKEKIKLSRLRYCWNGGRENHNDESVLEALQPPQNLKGLTFQNYMGRVVPSWFSTNKHCVLNNLVRLELDNCYKCEKLPMLGQLPCLERLSIFGTDNLREIGSEFYCGSNTVNRKDDVAIQLFPVLKTLKLRFMRNLEEWVLPPPAVAAACGGGDVAVFPRLENLDIESCPKLRSISMTHHCSTSLKKLSKLRILRCPELTRLPEEFFTSCLKELTVGGFSEELDAFPAINSIQQLHGSLEYLRLYGWNKLNSLPDEFQHLTALKSLWISEFNEVEALPEWLGNLSSLEDLGIGQCRNLKCLPSFKAMQSLSTLRCLSIHECPLLGGRCERKSGPEWHKISRIPTIFIDGRNVQVQNISF